MKLIFLDIDGVLNNHPCWPKGPELHRPQCDLLQQIIERTGAKIVLTSSWRNWLADGSMTLVGFSRLLQTHGVTGAEVVGYLRVGPVDAGDRTKAIREYLWGKGAKFIVLDDLPLAIETLVRTDGHAGLTAEHVEQACGLLGEKGS